MGRHPGNGWPPGLTLYLVYSIDYGLVPCKSWFRVVLRPSTAWLDWFPHSIETWRSTSEISKGNVLRYYRNLGSLRYGNEYCIPGHAMLHASVAFFEEIWVAVAEQLII